ncbi:protein phosphatase, putative [Leishmania panamensis]|uniref:Protein phosphatase, putative n=1 Tax=Leishmania panamensis TaxID=5679 RepID=A0A088RSQ0_LEIPA|nr:protein phosphatase, putative [Leishmania panamensis]AIN98940.1 protein phosphatase, putative [Leishmania panamensis]
MGIPLPKPVMTQLQERYGNAIFRCGSNCVNGYRETMEDAHLTYLTDSWGFFGVFDGHVNDQCSQYLEKAWRSAIENEPIPMTDDRMKELALRIDQEWMDSGREGGSTGTFFVALKEGNKVHLQVGNVGDSRVVACIDGACVPLTEDHKPNNEGERQRIENCSGRVENNRVDGSLAVSRAFGDREYKLGGGGQLEQKVIALADVQHRDFTFNSEDFVLLCCDGVFEGNFPNEEVVAYVKQQLETCNDLAEVAGRVCEEAIERGSRDNISCMIVQFRNGVDYAAEPHFTVVPGPFSAPRNSSFRKAYESMADKGNTTVGALLEKRYDTLKAADALTPEETEELSQFEDGPDAKLTGAERQKWFSNYFQKLCEASTNGPGDQMERLQSLQQQAGIPLSILLSLMGEQTQ